MRALTTALTITVLLMTASSCRKEKDDEPQQVATPLQYSSLTAASTSLGLGATTQVTAGATGEGLTYTWSASAGDIIGSGSQVIYGASGCCTGDNDITCVVKDAANNEQSKTVVITVHL